MTRTTNARIAGATFLIYIAAGMASMALSGSATSGADVAARIANAGQHAGVLRLTILLTLVQSFSALILGVTLWSLTRDVDRDLSMFGMACRLAEGISGVALVRTMGILWLATPGATDGLAPGGAGTLATLLLRMGPWNANAIYFAAGSTAFAWLMVRGQLVSTWLAWLGVVASVLLVVLLPVQLSGLADGVINWGGVMGMVMWLPMLIFELALAGVLIVRGLALPASARPV